ncbi:HD domain-containing protein [Actinomadura fibrosa]|uniref:HD domain-containing protein n=1 Tax=Actinomadura fibrosa TaxID=111802 RepID=A0ABW2Y122_9ACTN|nr:HD domain-containing protein [Actinomadura fibrosa]
MATAYHTPSLLNHSIRAYLWAAAHARVDGIAFDAELLYVSALLHDIGLVAAFDSHTVPFEEAGGHVAWVFGAGAGWSPERRARASEIIVRHMWPEVPATEDPEGHLLEASTAMDISGRDIDRIPAELRHEVLERYPRLDLATEFMACFNEQAARKPDSTAAQSVAGGVADRIARNPLDT